MTRRRGELPRELGLQIRMLLAMAISALLLAAVLVLAGWLLLFVENGWSAVLFVAGAAAVGAIKREGFVPRRVRQATDEDRRRTEGAIQRLALMADVPAPRVAVQRARTPLSWTTALRPSRATVHVTTGLLDRLDDPELEAVVAHELGHLVHRDAIVMTALAGPPAWFLLGIRDAINEDPFRGLVFSLTAGLLLIVPASIMLAIARIVSRHREFAADRAAALLTGSPARVVAALTAVDGELAGLPKRDLRMAYPRDSFHFVPAKRPRHVFRLWATHPRIEKRIARLERLEAGLQRA